VSYKPPGIKYLFTTVHDMPKLGLVNSLTSYVARVTAVIRRFWQNEFDLWQAMGDVWEQQN